MRYFVFAEKTSCGQEIGNEKRRETRNGNERRELEKSAAAIQGNCPSMQSCVSFFQRLIIFYTLPITKISCEFGLSHACPLKLFLNQWSLDSILISLSTAPFKKEHMSNRGSSQSRRNHEYSEIERPKSVQTFGSSTSAVSTASSRFEVNPIFHSSVQLLS